ncbi:MAG: peptidylprolyl isomerase [Bacteroidota bacterium]|nr:peptidylprolyl isomerase [Bacteroidota bacterium]
MKRVVLSFVLSVFVTVLSAQDVLTIADKNISLEEFKSIFYKNNHNAEITKEYLEEYMDLFVNFKLKVREAEELGLDTNHSFITELEGYRKQLAKPYLKNNEFDAQMLTESYDRMKTDVNASHILISVDEKASDKDEKAAYNKALKIRESIIDGKVSFSEAAKNSSDDQSVVSNGGDLGYFTAFMMVYDFETAAYETLIGEISMPVKTKYGYHLIQVNNRRDAVGQVKVAHIMFKTGEGADKNRINEANDKINKVMDLLKSGEEFSDVAERFSEDRATAVKGGSLPAFGVGKMVPEFESIAFALNNIGDISDPFLTDYGWHIIKLIEKTPIPEFSEIESDLKRMIEKDSRGALSQKALYEKLHNSYQVRNRAAVYASFRKGAALKVMAGNFVVSSVNNATLLTINGVAVSVNDFANYILENQSVGSDIDQMYTDFVDEQLLIYEDSKLEEKYPEYKALLKEYREGILLFDLTNKKVWTKAVEDTIGLQAFFTANQFKYTWPERVDATIYSCIDLATAKMVKRNIYKKNRGNITDAEILKEINTNAPLSLQINAKKFIKGENEYIDNLDWQEGIAKDIMLKDGSYILVDIHQILPAGVKELNETRGKVISDYQNTLEKEWLVNLKLKYSVKINMEALYSLIK